MRSMNQMNQVRAINELNKVDEPDNCEENPDRPFDDIVGRGAMRLVNTEGINRKEQKQTIDR